MRVLVATAIALLVIMVSRSCVANSDQAAAATPDQLLPKSEEAMPVELEDEEDFDLINDHDENELVQLTNFDHEESSPFEPTHFVSNCSATNNLSTCRTPIRFTAMGTMYDMEVKVNIRYNKTKNCLHFQMIVNNRCIGRKCLSGAENKVQSMCKPYSLKGVTFTVCIQTKKKNTNLDTGEIGTCSMIKITASNKTWATAFLGCVILK